MPIQLNEKNRAEIIKSDSNLMLYFTASWCGPCKRMKPEYNNAEEYLKDYETGLIFTMTDVDESETLARDYAIESMPTILIIKKGKIVEKSEGAINKDKILQMIGKHFYIKDPKSVKNTKNINVNVKDPKSVNEKFTVKDPKSVNVTVKDPKSVNVAVKDPKSVNVTVKDQKSVNVYVKDQKNL